MGFHLKHKVKTRNRSLYYRTRNAEIINKIKTTVGCLLCSERGYAAVIDFHHIDPTEKETEISIISGFNLTKTFEELQKCVAVCRNCHVKIHGGLLVVDEFERKNQLSIINDIINNTEIIPYSIEKEV